MTTPAPTLLMHYSDGVHILCHRYGQLPLDMGSRYCPECGPSATTVVPLVDGWCRHPGGAPMGPVSSIPPRLVLGLPVSGGRPRKRPSARPRTWESRGRATRRVVQAVRLARLGLSVREIAVLQRVGRGRLLRELTAEGVTLRRDGHSKRRVVS